MKKIIIALFLIPIFLKADFLDELQKIDLLLQKGNYTEALNESNALLKTELSNEDKLALENLINKINEKISEVSESNPIDRLFNNTGSLNFTTEEGLEGESVGTVSYSEDVINSPDFFTNINNIEKEVLASKDSNNINSLIKIYMKSGLYERAMKLGLKDSDLRNIYLSALAARLIGKYDISISQYNKVLASQPDHLNSLLGIGLAYRAKKDNSKALTYLTKYVNNGGNNPNVTKAINDLSR